MRAFLDSILIFLNIAALTDEEFDEIDLETQEYSIEVYEALKAILMVRGEPWKETAKLKQYFKLKGVDFDTKGVHVPKSNIFIGRPL